MLSNLESAYSVCEQITQSSAKNFFYAFRVLPKEKRSAIYVVYVFCRMCDDIADGTLPNQAKFDKLQEIAKFFNRPFNKSIDSESPVFLALHDVIIKYKIPKNYFTEFIDGMIMDQTINRYSDFSELELYCHKVASVVGLICIEIFGYKDKSNNIFASADKLGIAMQLTNIIRDIKDDIKRNRIYIPQSDLLKFGYTETQLKESVYNKRFCSLMEFQTQRIRSLFNDSRELDQLINEDSRSCIKILRSLYLKILYKIEASEYDLYGPEISLSKKEKIETMLKLWIHHIGINFTNKLKSIIING